MSGDEMTRGSATLNDVDIKNMLLNRYSRRMSSRVQTVPVVQIVQVRT